MHRSPPHLSINCVSPASAGLSDSAVVRAGALAVLGLAYRAVDAGNSRTGTGSGGVSMYQVTCSDQGSHGGKDPPVASQPTLSARLDCVRINVADRTPVVVETSIRRCALVRRHVCS